MKTVFSFRFLTILFLAISYTSIAQLPYLKKENGATKLIVDGKPFIILGGELHNSTGSDKEAMQWEVESGGVKVLLGSSSQAIQLQSTFTVSK